MKGFRCFANAALVTMCVLALPLGSCDRSAEDPPSGTQKDVPIVLVPGTPGSLCWEVILGDLDIARDKWQLADDFTHSIVNTYYGRFGEAVKGKQIPLQKCPYDWRQPVPEIVKNFLMPAIDKARSENSATSVDIVAHSFGGIVARYYVESDLYRNDVRNLVLVAVPNHGITDIYYMWEGGKVPAGGWSAFTAIEQGIIEAHRIRNGYATDVEALQKCAPGVKWAMPIFDYLKEDATATTIPEKNMKIRNTDLAALLTTPTLSASGVHPYQIYGYGEDTRRFIRVRKYSGGNPLAWVDGEPVTPEMLAGGGDDFVLKSSAHLPEIPASDTLSLLIGERTHGEMLSDSRVQAQIFEFLGYKKTALPAKAAAQSDAPTSVLLVYGFRAPNIQVTTPRGKAGWDPAAGRELKEVPDTIYGQSGDSSVLIMFKPEEGEYDARPVGTTATLPSLPPGAKALDFKAAATTGPLLIGFYADAKSTEVTQLDLTPPPTAIKALGPPSPRGFTIRNHGIRR
jgi:pimeloyl-ACP methyl ester carboxylesterase